LYCILGLKKQKPAKIINAHSPFCLNACCRKQSSLRPADDDSPYVVLTTWKDKAAFEAWVGSEDFRQAHRNPLPKEAYREGGRLERHEVVIEAIANVD
jgi:hypothetical protein